jgi:UDP-glucose 4-epimerase
MLSEGSPAFVTGGAGFIGATLVGLLRSRGVPVTVVDRVPFSSATRLAAFEGDDGFSYHAMALDDAARLERIVDGHTTFFHLAANTENRSDRADADADISHTVIGTTVLLQALAALPEATIVLASSQLVYAPGGAGERITEGSGALAPPTRFAAGKAAAEAFLHAHCREHDHSGATCRLANIVGPQMRRGIVHDLTAAVRADPARLEVLGDGRQTRSFLHVEDCAAAMMLAATQSEDYAIYNVCNEDAISAAEVAEIVADETVGERPKIGFTGGEGGWRGDVPTLRVWPEALLARGWQPSMDSREAVRSTAKAMLAAEPEPPPAVVAVQLRRPPAVERWQVLGCDSLYASQWVGLSLVSVKPPGRDPYDHHVVSLPPAVGIVLNCPEKGVLLLHRHRFITDSTGFEIPAGGIDDDESIEAAAGREALEETGWHVAGVERLLSCNVSDGVSDQRFHLVLARPDRYSGPPADLYEATSRAWVDRYEIRELIREGKVPGALSIVALLYALSFDRI